MLSIRIANEGGKKDLKNVLAICIERLVLLASISAGLGILQADLGAFGAEANPYGKNSVAPRNGVAGGTRDGIEPTSDTSATHRGW